VRSSANSGQITDQSRERTNTWPRSALASAVSTTQRCALSGVVLDDGDPLHRARVRRFLGRELVVSLAVAHLLDRPGTRPADVERFAATMAARAART
jgi:hypothetical protein